MAHNQDTKKSSRKSVSNSSVIKPKPKLITKEMYDAVTAELASSKQQFSKLAADYQTLVDKVNNQQAQVHTVVNAQAPPEVSPDPILSTLQQQLNERKEDALRLSANMFNLEQRWSYFDHRLHQIDERLNNQNIELEEQKQYSMRNDLMLKKLSNIPVKSDGESFSKFSKRFDTWVYETLNNLLPNLETKLTLNDIDTAHVLYDGSDVVLVRFANRRARNDVLFNKRDLRGHHDKVTISEHLTPFRYRLLNKAKNIVGKHNAWSKKCEIFVKIRRTVYRVWSEDEVRHLSSRVNRNYSFRRPHDDSNSSPVLSTRNQAQEGNN